MATKNEAATDSYFLLAPKLRTRDSMTDATMEQDIKQKRNNQIY